MNTVDNLLRIKDLNMLEDIYKHLFDDIVIRTNDYTLIDYHEYYDLLVSDIEVARKYADEAQYRESMDRMFLFKNTLDFIMKERD